MWILTVDGFPKGRFHKLKHASKALEQQKIRYPESLIELKEVDEHGHEVC